MLDELRLSKFYDHLCNVCTVSILKVGRSTGAQIKLRQLFAGGNQQDLQWPIGGRARKSRR